MNTQDGLGYEAIMITQNRHVSETGRYQKSRRRVLLIFEYVVKNAIIPNLYWQTECFLELERQEGTSFCKESLWSTNWWCIPITMIHQLHMS